MIRPAKLSDAQYVIPILLQIFDEMELTALAEVSNEALSQMLIAAFKEPTYRYGYRHMLVYEDDDTNEILGLAVGYPAQLEANIDDALAPYFQMIGLPSETRLFSNDESRPGEWYLDSLAVAPHAQGRGIGSQLLSFLPEYLKKQGQSILSLSVDLKNPLAKKLYVRHGFVEDGYTMIDRHKYDHMIKRLD